MGLAVTGEAGSSACHGKAHLYVRLASICGPATAGKEEGSSVSSAGRSGSPLGAFLRRRLLSGASPRLALPVSITQRI